MTASKPLYAYLSAAALALVTIFTFYVFQDFGPQSVLRRFHRDVARGDLNDINQITTDGVNSQATQFMIGRVEDAVNADATYEIGGMRRFHTEVLATVEYRYPTGLTRAVNWHVRQGPTDWRVDCEATVLGMRLPHL